MKQYSADYIYPINEPPIKNGVVGVDDDGKILSLLNPEFDKINWDNVECFKGIICPGFVNTHCHLELSYLKGRVEEQTKLHGFVGELMAIRDEFSDEQKLAAIKEADEEMYANGILAVGDISNGASTFQQKQHSRINYHTFVELFGLNPNDIEIISERKEWLVRHYHNKNRISTTPHAPYSISSQLKELINKDNNELLTIHNQETASENQLFKSGSGELFNQLSRFSEEIKKWQPTGKNSLPSYLRDFGADKRILLVHNTYTAEEDVLYAKNYSNNIYWCFCPNANLYIENQLPDFNLFLNEKCTIGTDSLASNWSLSILDELKIINKTNTLIKLDLLLKWGTLNGAEFLGFENQLGSLEVGKTPGLNLIKNVDLDNLHLTTESTVIPLK